ncbi:MAG: hypothetical protein JZU63_12410, partial [Rhodoferax sp.]|nr:hypothetical protein [Rhodoferax sp.]
MFTISIETSHYEVASPMYQGPVPTPCVIYKPVMVDTTNEGDQRIFNEDSTAKEPTGIMALEGNTIKFLHHQELNDAKLTKKYPLWEFNGTVVNTEKIREVEVDGKTTIKYKPSAKDVFMTVTLKEEPKVADEEDEVMDEEVMEEEKEEKKEEEDEEVMSDEEGKKEEVSVNDKHPNLLIAQAKAKQAAEAVAAKELADKLKLAQDKADQVAYDELTAPIKAMFDDIHVKQAELKTAENVKFIMMWDRVEYIPYGIIPEFINVIKPVGRKDARVFDVFKSRKENETLMKKMLKVAHWINNINKGSDATITRNNITEDA